MKIFRFRWKSSDSDGYLQTHNNLQTQINIFSSSWKSSDSDGQLQTHNIFRPRLTSSEPVEGLQILMKIFRLKWTFSDPNNFQTQINIFSLSWKSSYIDENLQTQMEISRPRWISWDPIENLQTQMNTLWPRWKSSDLDENLQTPMNIFKRRWNFQIFKVNEVSLEVKIHGIIFWVMIRSNVANCFHHFGRNYYLQLQTTVYSIQRIWFSKALVNTYQNTRCYNSNDCRVSVYTYLYDKHW